MKFFLVPSGVSFLGEFIGFSDVRGPVVTKPVRGVKPEAKECDFVDVTHDFLNL